MLAISNLLCIINNINQNNYISRRKPMKKKKYKIRDYSITWWVVKVIAPIALVIMLFNISYAYGGPMLR